MNAYELADYVEAREQNNATLKEAAEMLRTQVLSNSTDRETPFHIPGR